MIDISKIDFGALAAKLKASKSQKLELEQLKAAIRAQLDRLVRFNPTRADYVEKFEALIDSYNAGSRNIDDLFRQLLELTQTLTVEQERHVRESLSEEELTVFDVLTRPGPELTPEERDEVKKVARHLLKRLRDLLVIEWRDKNRTRARVQTEIQDLLDAELPRPTRRTSTRRSAGLCTSTCTSVTTGMGALRLATRAALGE